MHNNSVPQFLLALELPDVFKKTLDLDFPDLNDRVGSFATWEIACAVARQKLSLHSLLMAASFIQLAITAVVAGWI
jgi:hypothetical protein